MIVLCLNEAARLPLLLADLQQSQFPLEILVSDGGSDDASPQIAELAGGRVIPSNPLAGDVSWRSRPAKPEGIGCSFSMPTVG